MIRVVVFADDDPIAVCEDQQVAEACLLEIAADYRMQALLLVERDPDRADSLCRQARVLDGQYVSAVPALNGFWAERREMAAQDAP